jgi:hypothetical protein
MFYIKADSLSYTNNAFLVVAISSLIMHLIGIGFLYQGQLDLYTLIVINHQTLMVTGLQFIHLLKFQRRSWHRWFFVANTIAVVFEFISSWAFAQWTARSYCPALRDAIQLTQGQRYDWTIPALTLSIILSILDVSIATWDKHNNKNVDRKKGEHSRPSIRRVVLWKRANWNWQRIVYCLVGMLWTIFSIYNVEYFIIRGFHEFVQGISGVSSPENGWSPGQILTLAATAITIFAAILRPYLISVTLIYAQKERGPSKFHRF